MGTPQIENSPLGKKETKGFEKYYTKFKAAVIRIGKRKVTDKKKSTSAISNPSTHKPTTIERSIKKTEENTIVKDQSTVEMQTTKDSIENSATATVNHTIVNDQDEDSGPILEPMKSFLLLNSHDTIIPLNTDSFTCPQCHTPHSVHYVHEDTEQGQSKELYICLSHGNHGCGWEGAEKPDEDDIHARITADIGFKPLRLN